MLKRSAAFVFVDVDSSRSSKSGKCRFPENDPSRAKKARRGQKRNRSDDDDVKNTPKTFFASKMGLKTTSSFAPRKMDGIGVTRLGNLGLFGRFFTHAHWPEAQMIGYFLGYFEKPHFYSFH